jgi:hypothetical protein
VNARARSDQRIADSRHHHLDKNLVTTTARPETLIPGNCYFSLGYYDNDLVLPMVETLVYVGQEHYAEHGRTWLFKEPDSPPIPNEETEPPPLTAFTDRELHRIVDIEGLIRLLRELAADHPLKSLPQANVEPPTSEDFDAVVEEVTRFPETPEYNALTMVIQFTDDGLSLARREGGIEMQLDAHRRRHPGEDARILSLFAALGGGASPGLS